MQKFWAIKLHHWPRIESLSSADKESRCLPQLSNNLAPAWGLIWNLKLGPLMSQARNVTCKPTSLLQQSVQMWELEHWRTDTFWIVVLEKTLESPLKCKEAKPVNLKGNQPWIFMEGLMLKLKLQYFGHLMQRADLLEKTLMLGKIEGKSRRGWQRMRQLDSITSSMDMNLSKLQETMEDRGAWHAVSYRIANSWTQLSDWTTTTTKPNMYYIFHCSVVWICKTL